MRSLFILSILLVCQTAFAEESLCNEQEKIVFSCHAGRKMIALCKVLKAPKNLIYRYGTPEHVELTYPDTKKNEQGKFHTSSSPLYGGEVTFLFFKRGVYEYRIFSKIGRMDSNSHQEHRIPEFEDGIEVSKKGKPIKRMVCEDGGAGFREDIEAIISE